MLGQELGSTLAHEANAQSVNQAFEREFLRSFDLIEDVLGRLVGKSLQTKKISFGEFVNIGAGQDVPITELALLARNTAGFEGEIRHDATKKDGVPRKLLDSSRMRKLGWSPTIGLVEGVRQTYAWYCQQETTGQI